MADSQKYEVLSFEEIDQLKKESTVLASRIDAVKRKLVLETKLRDAAQSLNRLHSSKGRDGSNESSPISPKKHRRSILSRGSSNELLHKTEDEMAIATRKCEDLAQELWRLEKRSQEIEKRLVEHSAGILQITHKGFVDKDPSSAGFPNTNGDLNGYASPNGPKSGFDDRSNYRSYSVVDDYDPNHPNGFSGSGPPSMPSAEYAKQTEAILSTEKRIEDLNARLREMISQVNPRRAQQMIVPKKGAAEKVNPSEELLEQVQLLEKGLETMHEGQIDDLRNASDSVLSAEEALENVNTLLYSTMTKLGPGQASGTPTPPRVTGQGLDSQLKFLQGGLVSLNKEIQRLDEAAGSSNEQQAQLNQHKTTLTGLWDLLAAGDHDSQKEVSGKRALTPMGREDYSLQSFSGKVQGLYARATSLSEQKDILTRQVQQQRELHDKSIGEKEAQLELARHQADKEAKEIRDELIVATARLDQTHQDALLAEKQRGMTENTALQAEKAARKQSEGQLMIELKSRQNVISELESNLKSLQQNQGVERSQLELQSKRSEDQLKKLETQLHQAIENAAFMEANASSLARIVEDKTQEVDKAQSEMKHLESEYLRMNTELTMLKAEFDVNGGGGKGGSGGGPRAQKERIQLLEAELAELIAEYEAMTKASIEFEKERESLENQVDELRDRIEGLENQLSDVRVQAMGARTPGGNNERKETVNTSTSVLKNEFKKMMRETRGEHMKAMKVC